MRESKDLEGARVAFIEQLELDRAIAKADPNNVTSLTDLAWSLNRLGDLDRDASKPNEAARYYEEALGIQRKLIAREPDSLVRMRALASIVSKLGSVRARTSDYTTALTLHQEELDLRRRLFQRAADDDNDALRDLSLALDRVGNVLRDMSDFRGALKYFEEELTIDRRFVARAPNNLTALDRPAMDAQQARRFRAAAPRRPGRRAEIYRGDDRGRSPPHRSGADEQGPASQAQGRPDEACQPAAGAERPGGGPRGLWRNPGRGPSAGSASRATTT